jgi:hypothetical protein
MKKHQAKHLVTKKLIGIFIASSVLIGLLTMKTSASSLQQINISATPASIILPTSVLATEGIATPTATYTPTPPGAALLEAFTEANVRAEPDPESELLGTIRAGDLYTVIGRYYRWYQFRYDQTPGQTGWVFDELVQITGDESQIRDLTEDAVPTTDPTSVAGTATIEAITQTPGGILTATAEAVIIPLPVQPGNGGATPETANSSSVLPTFTYPPDVAVTPPESAYKAANATFDSTPTLVPNSLEFVVTEGAPPIVPILVLAGIGLFGLVISTFRR